jgi:alkylation response protein AidB-like acyl-CoA dehydrogenase
MAVTDAELPAHAGQSMFLVPTDTPVYEIVRDLKTMGMHGFAGHPETRCTDVELPADAILGERGKGFAIAQSRLGAGRMGHAMRWIGVGQKALDLAADRALNRETFGEPLATRQAVQWWLADGATLLYASRLMVLHTCWKVDQGLPHRTEVSMVKTFVAEALGQIVDHALQVFGGWGYTQDYPLEKWYRDARAARIYDGPSEVHRMLVARQVLRDVERTGTAASVGTVLEALSGDRGDT